MNIVATLALLVSPVFMVQAGKPGPAPSLIRVFVEADGVEGKEFTDRKQSAKDLTDALVTKKKTIMIVDDEDRADVVVNVNERTVEVPKVVLGVDVRPGRATGMGAPVTRAILKVKLTSGAVTLDLKNKNTANDNPRGWKSAAEDLADQVEKWINAHKSEILDRRGGSVLVSR